MTTPNRHLSITIFCGVLSVASVATAAGEVKPPASESASTQNTNSLSAGRFNSVLGFGAMTAYGLKRDNKTMVTGGVAASALAYKKWSRSRTRHRAGEVNHSTIYGDLNSEEYETRRGRGDTAKGMALLPAYGLATGKRTFLVAGGIATILSYRRYQQTRRDARHFEERQQNASKIADATHKASTHEAVTPVQNPVE